MSVNWKNSTFSKSSLYSWEDFMSTAVHFKPLGEICTTHLREMAEAWLAKLKWGPSPLRPAEETNSLPHFKTLSVNYWQHESFFITGSQVWIPRPHVLNVFYFISHQGTQKIQHHMLKHDFGRAIRWLTSPLFYSHTAQTAPWCCCLTLQLCQHWQRQKQLCFLAMLTLKLPVLNVFSMQLRSLFTTWRLMRGWVVFCALGIRVSCYWLLSSCWLFITGITAMWLWIQVALYIHVCPCWHFILWILKLEAWSWSFMNITSSVSDPDSAPEVLNNGQKGHGKVALCYYKASSLYPSR